MRGLVVAGVVSAGVGCSSATTSIEQAWISDPAIDPDCMRDLIGNYTQVVATELSRREVVATP